MKRKILSALIAVAGVALVAFALAILLPIFASARVAAFNAKRYRAAKEIAVAVLIYSADNGDRLPLNRDWATRSHPSREWLRVREDAPFSFAMNSKLGGKKIEDLDGASILITEYWSVSMNQVTESKPELPPKLQHIYCGLVDGTARRFRHEQVVAKVAE